MNQQQLERDVRFLKRYAMLTTAALVVGCFAAFKQNPAAPAGGKVKFTEIDVERINIVEPDGKYRIVLSNRPRSIGPIYKGKPFGYEGGGRPGHDLLQRRRHRERRLHVHGHARRGRHGIAWRRAALSFDQFDQDQIFVTSTTTIRTARVRMGSR